MRSADAGPDDGWRVIEIGLSAADSPEPRSGDYLGIAPLEPGREGWVGTCMTLHETDDGTWARVHVASFGVREDVGG
jgi:hypothetical protein